MWKVVGRVVTILDPGAQFSRGPEICNRILVVATRRLVPYRRFQPSPTRSSMKRIEARGQLVGNGFIDDYQRHAAGFFGRQLQPGSPVPGFNSFLAGAGNSIFVGDARLNILILVDPGEASNRGMVFPGLVARLT